MASEQAVKAKRILISILSKLYMDSCLVKSSLTFLTQKYPLFSCIVPKFGALNTNKL